MKKRLILAASLLMWLPLHSCDLEDVTDDPVVDNPTNNDKPSNDPVTDDPNDEDKPNNDPVNDDPVNDDPINDDPINDDPVNEDPVPDEPIVDTPEQGSGHVYSEDPKIREYELMWPEEQLIRANTAKDAVYMTEMARQVVYFCNLARMNGKLYAETFLQYSNPSPTDDYYITLLDCLNGISNMKMLMPEEELTKAAQSHAEDTGKNGHNSADGTGATDRVCNKFGCANYRAENISWVYNFNALSHVNNLLIDHGNAPGYGHRYHILSPGYYAIGVGSSTESNGRNCMVQDFGTPGNKSLMDYLHENFSAAMIEKADVARNCNYLSETEKGVFLLANLGRLDMSGFYQKVYKDFFGYFEKEEDARKVAEFFRSKNGVEMPLLMPDKALMKDRIIEGIGKGYTPDGPDLSKDNSVEPRGGAYRKNIYGDNTIYRVMECSWDMMFSEEFRSAAPALFWGDAQWGPVGLLAFHKSESTD